MPAVLRIHDHHRLESLRPVSTLSICSARRLFCRILIIAIAFIFLGSLLSNDLVWELTDMFNQLMVIPNVIALLALGGLVAASAKAGNSETLENVKK